MAKKKFKHWHYCNFYEGYKIGEGTRFGSFCDIGGVIGKNCIIHSFVFIPEGVIIEDDCFIGPRVTFTNVKYPPIRKTGDILRTTIVKKGASIGAGVIILPGIEIGENSMIGAGSVVTKSIPPNEVWVGNPATLLKEIKE